MTDSELVRWGTPTARRLLLTCVLGSSMAFLDGTVVNVALPAISEDLDAGLAGLQWVVNAYLVSLTAFVLLGGLLGDRYGRRRVFLVGVVAFTLTSILCGAAPNLWTLVLARALQGVAAALLVPGSLAMLTGSFHPEDRSRAVGSWSGLSGVSAAVGPLLGGWLVESFSWRWVFLINVPLAAVTLVAARGLPADLPAVAPPSLDLGGALTVAASLGLLTAGAIEHGASWSWYAIAAGAALFVAFLLIEARGRDPMMPLSLFTSQQFSGANAVTFVVYAGFGVSTFLLVVVLQTSLGYSPIEAGAAEMPITILMLLLSSRAGALAQRIGPTLPMTVGPLVIGLGLAWLSILQAGDSYFAVVLPSMTVLGLGLAITVAPLTAVVLAAVDERHLGVGSGVNNAVARLAGLFGVAVIPALAGFDLTAAANDELPGFQTSILIGAGMCVVGGLISLLTIRRAEVVTPTVQASPLVPCGDPCRREEAAAA